VIDPRAVEAFIYHEARLVDEMDYTAWFALWDRDGRYHVPIGADPASGQGRQVSIINDDYLRLEQRIEVLAETPDGEVEIGSNFILGVARTAEQQMWIGRTLHRLRSAGAGFRIARKTVLLINSEHETPLLQFII
jgi:3-phenylpropionate/cinnamic acid dioxygenase small subunit